MGRHGTADVTGVDCRNRKPMGRCADSPNFGDRIRYRLRLVLYGPDVVNPDCPTVIRLLTHVTVESRWL